MKELTMWLKAIGFAGLVTASGIIAALLTRRKRNTPCGIRGKRWIKWTDRKPKEDEPVVVIQSHSNGCGCVFIGGAVIRMIEGMHDPELLYWLPIPEQKMKGV